MTRHQKWYAENKDYFVKYRENNRERHNERAREWNKKNPIKAKLSHLKYRLKKTENKENLLKFIEKVKK